MKKYNIGYAYATNLPEYFAADMEPTLSLEDCRELPLATPLSDGVVFNEIERIDSPFSLYSENDSFLLHIKTTASGPALAFVSDVVAVRAMMAKLGGSKLHLGLNADGVKTDRALLIVPTASSCTLVRLATSASASSSATLPRSRLRPTRSPTRTRSLLRPRPFPSPLRSPRPSLSPRVIPSRLLSPAIPSRMASPVR